jgi:sulfite reductase beta subunit-like hemoprotein
MRWPSEAPRPTSPELGAAPDRIWARAKRIVADVGEEEFRRGVAEMSGFDTDALNLDPPRRL